VTAGTNDAPSATGGSWPDLRVSTWAGTKRAVHLYLQMLGKMRVALSPFQPNWMFTPLYLTGRGFTTGAMPVGLGSLEARLDVFDSSITVARSDGETRTIPLLPVRTIAEIYGALSAAVTELHVSCVITTEPQEVPDTTPLHEDHRACEYDVAAVQRWFRAFTATAAVFERWRAHFFGRSGVQLWWGVLDLALILFTGKHVTAPTDRGYLMKYDLDAELMNVGLYLGDEQSAPFFYGYIYPEPPGAPGLAVRPAATSWSDSLHEWILPYDAVRTAQDPEAEIRALLDSIYEQCIAAAGWDRDALAYVAPKSRQRTG
jgi:uncharacterized protein DUF5996